MVFGPFAHFLILYLSRRLTVQIKKCLQLTLLNSPLVGLPVVQLVLLCPTVTHSKQIPALCIAELAPGDQFDINSCYSE